MSKIFITKVNGLVGSGEYYEVHSGSTMSMDVVPGYLLSSCTTLNGTEVSVSARSITFGNVVSDDTLNFVLVNSAVSLQSRYSFNNLVGSVSGANGITFSCVFSAAGMPSVASMIIGNEENSIFMRWYPIDGGSSTQVSFGYTTNSLIGYRNIGGTSTPVIRPQTFTSGFIIDVSDKVEFNVSIVGNEAEVSALALDSRQAGSIGGVMGGDVAGMWRVHFESASSPYGASSTIFSNFLIAGDGSTVDQAYIVQYSADNFPDMYTLGFVPLPVYFLGNKLTVNLSTGTAMGEGIDFIIDANGNLVWKDLPMASDIIPGDVIRVMVWSEVVVQPDPVYNMSWHNVARFSDGANTGVSNLISQYITFPTIGSVVADSGPVPLFATTTSGLPITYTSSNPSVCTVVNGALVVVGAGTAVITANQAGSPTYAPAATRQQEFVVTPVMAAQTITFASTGNMHQSDNTVTLNGFSSSGLPLTYTSSNTAVATVSGSVLTQHSVGVTIITASQDGNDSFFPAAPVTQTFTVITDVIVPQPQTITFSALPSKTYGDASFELVATSSSGLSVSFSSSNTSVCTVIGSTATVVAAGSYSIIASQGGNAYFQPATDVENSGVFSKKAQTITFDSLSDKTYGDEAFVLTATSDSGLLVTYSSIDPAVCSVSTNLASINAAGTTTINAIQAGDTNYLPATNVQQSLVVQKKSQAITFNPVSDRQYGSGTFALNASSTSGLAIDYSSSDPAVCSVSGGTFTINSVGSYTVTAAQVGNTNYLPATSVMQSASITKADQVISFTSIGSKSTNDVSFELEASSTSGLTIVFTSSDPAVATVSGSTVTIVGSGPCTIYANQVGNSLYNPASFVARSFTVADSLVLAMHMDGIDDSKSFIELKNHSVTSYGETKIVENSNPFLGRNDNVDVWDKVVLALDGESLTDLKGNTITPFGNVVSTTAEKKFGSKSIYFDGSGDYLEVPSSSNFDFGSGDFTIEFWFNATSTSNHTIYNKCDSGGSEQSLRVLIGYTGVTLEASSTGVGIQMSVPALITLELNVWKFYSLSRKNDTFYIFVDGILRGSLTQAITIRANTLPVSIGYNPHTATWYTSGYIDSLVITKGIAKYTSNFVVQNEQVAATNVDPYWGKVVLAMPMTGADGSTTFIDLKGNTVTPYGNAKISTNQSKFGGSSAYFDGAGDYLTVPNTGNLILGNNNFTIDAWVMRVDDTHYNAIIGDWYGGTDFKYVFDLSPGGYLGFEIYENGVDYYVNSGSTSVPKNTWAYVSAVRDGTSMRIYLDGVLVGSIVIPAAVSVGVYSSVLYIGKLLTSDSSSTYSSYGYIADLRITKGIARYTSNFTPPTSEITSSDPYWNNIVLALDGESISDLKGHALTINGSVTVSTTTKKFGSSSLFFNGSGSYLNTAWDSAFNFGSGDFTIETYFNAAFLGTNPGATSTSHIMLTTTPLTSTSLWAINIESNKLMFYIFQYSTRIVHIVHTPDILIDQWYHVAIVRGGGILKMFVDGSLAGSVASTHDLSGVGSGIAVGRGNDNSGGWQAWYHGYLDSLVITKGIAKYSANFTPPTQSFATQTSNQIANIWNYTSLALPFNNFIDQKGQTVSKYGDTNIVEQGNPFDQDMDIIDVWDKVVLALDGDTLTDLKGHSVSVVGNTSVSTTIKKFGTGSIYFDGTGDYLSIPHTAEFDFSSSDVTIECWVKVNGSNGVRTIYSHVDNVGGGIESNSYRTILSVGRPDFGEDNRVGFSARVGATTFVLNSTNQVVADKWTYISFTKLGLDYYIIFDGVVTSATAPGAINPKGSFSSYVGSSKGIEWYFSGYIDSLVITKGIAKYIKNFTPPTEQVSAAITTTEYNDPYWGNVVLAMPLNGANNSTTFTDLKGHNVTSYGNVRISTNQSKFGGSSAYFDGTEGYLSIPNSGDMVLGSSDFSIEAWVNVSSYVNNHEFAIIADWAEYFNINFGVNLGGILSFQVYGTLLEVFAVNTIPMNTWTHVACSRSGTNCKIFINGVLSGSGTLPINYSIPTYKPLETRVISYLPGYYNHGYLNDLRITKGIARYTANFTPPTRSIAPVVTTTSSNQKVDLYKHHVVLAMNMNGPNNSTKFIDQKGSSLTVSGSAQISTAKYKFSGASAYFDGSSFLTIPNSPNFDFGSGDFTMEFWFSATSTSNHTIYNKCDSGGYEQSLRVLIGNTGVTVEASSTGVGLQMSVPAVIPLELNVWKFYSVSRKNDTFYIFVDGVLKGSLTQAITIRANTLPVSIGYNPHTSTWYTNGYLDDLRITKGYSRYTSNFTPPKQSYLPSNKAVYFDGDGDYLTLTNNGEYDFGTGDFSIDVCFKATFLGVNPGAADTNHTIFSVSSGTNTHVLYIYNSILTFVLSLNSVTQVVSLLPENILENKWYFVSLKRVNGILQMCVDGILRHGTTSNHNFNIGGSVSIGKVNNASGSWSGWFKGYISDLRITKGITRPISLPTTSYLLSGQSAYFDGTGDYLQVPHSSDLDLGDTYTVEFAFMKGSSIKLEIGDYSNQSGLWNGLQFSIRQMGSGSDVRVYFWGTNATNQLSVDIPVSKFTEFWNHFSVVRNGTNGYVYVNGLLVSTIIVGGNVVINTTQGLKVGRWSSIVQEDMTGYIADLKIIKGEAKYTAPFVPPKMKFDGALPSDPYWKNTKLLLSAPHQAISSQTSNTADYKNLVDNSVVVTGVNALWQTTQKVNADFQGAYQFDGNGDYLSVPASSAPQFGVKSFTLECWIKPNAYSTSGSNIIDTRVSGGYAPFTFGIVNIYGKNRISFFTQNSPNIATAPVVPMLTNVWMHIALVRDNGKMNIYVDGVKQGFYEGSESLYGTTNLGTNNPINIGGGNGVGYFDGYIDQLRITLDIARYTGNFTPPTLPFNKPIL